MAISASFSADFSQFQSAVDKAVVKLRDLQSGSATASSSLSRIAQSFSGTSIIREATLTAEAVARLGKEGGIAQGVLRLTGTELQRAGALAQEAATKLTAMGEAVPAKIQTLANAIKPISEHLTLAQRAANLATSAFGQMFGAFSAVSLVNRATAAITNFTREAFNNASTLVDLANKTGLGIEALQRMSAVALETGTSVEALSEASFRLGVRLAGGGKSVRNAVAELGQSFEDITQASPEKKFEAIVTSLGKMGDETERNRLGVALFGRSFSAIASSVSADYQTIADSAGTSSEEQIRALDAVGDRWDAFVERQKRGLQSVLGSFAIFAEGLAKMPAWQQLQELLKGGVAGLAATAVGQGIGAGGPAPQAPAVPVIPDSFPVQLIKAQQELQKLTAYEKEQIDAALALGRSHEELADKIGITEDALKLYIDSTRNAGRTTRTAATAGGDFERSAREIADASRRAAEDVLALDTEMRELSVDMRIGVSTINTALDALTRTSELEDLVGQIETADANFNTLIDSLHKTGDAFGSTGRLIDEYGRIVSRSLGADATRALMNFGVKAGSSVSAGIASAFAQLPRLLEQAFTGGGGASGAIKALATDVGANITSALFDPLKGQFKNFTNQIAGMFGSSGLGGAIGKTLGEIIPGIGSLLGPAIAGLGSLLKKAFGGPSEEELEGRAAAKEFEQTLAKTLTATQKLEAGNEGWRKTTIAVRDAYLATGRSAEQAQQDVADLWAAEREGGEAVLEVQRRIQEAFDEQAADQARLTAAIEKYGFTIEQLGPTLQRQKLDEQAKELIEDWRVLVGAGVDIGAVNEKMAESINTYLQTALKVGAEIPAAMRPILQQLIDQGLLTDEAGNAITDLEKSGIKFSETMTEGFDRVVEKLDELIERLGLAGDELSKVGNAAANVGSGSSFLPGDRPWDPNEWPAGSELPRLSFAGGSGGFRSFGAGTPVMLHGREAVVTEGQAAAASVSLAGELRALRTDFNYFISIQPTALRDAVLRAPR